MSKPVFKFIGETRQLDAYGERVVAGPVGITVYAQDRTAAIEKIRDAVNMKYNHHLKFWSHAVFISEVEEVYAEED